MGFWSSFGNFVLNVVTLPARVIVTGLENIFGNHSSPEVAALQRNIANNNQIEANLRGERRRERAIHVENERLLRIQTQAEIDSIKKNSEIAAKEQQDRMSALKSQTDEQIRLAREESRRKDNEFVARIRQIEAETALKVKEAEEKIQLQMKENSMLKHEVMAFMEKNEELMVTVEQLKLNINNLVVDARGCTKEYYNQLKDWIDVKRVLIIYTSLIVMIGPKGNGKTTFCWLRGDCPNRPTRTLKDGTVEVHRIGAFIDTIGVNLEVNSILKLFATFFLTGVPDTAVICSNDRIERPLLVLNHLLISNPYVVMLNPKMVHKIAGVSAKDPPVFTTKEMETIYDLDGYEVCKKDGWAAVPITHLDEISLNHNIHNSFQRLFPGNIVSLPSWEDFQRDFELGETITTLQFQVCKFFKELVVDYEGNQLKFMNSYK